MKKRKIADIEKELIAMPDLTDKQIERCKNAAKKILYKDQDEIKFYYTTHYSGHYMYFCTKCQRWHSTTERFEKGKKHKCECGANLVVTGPVQNQYRTLSCDLSMIDRLDGELIMRMVHVERTIDKRCNYIEQFEIYEISRLNVDRDIAVKRYSLKTMDSWGEIWHSKYYEQGKRWSSDKRTQYYRQYRWINVIGPTKSVIRGTMFEYSVLDQAIKKIKGLDARMYLEAYKVAPDIEKFVKVGSFNAVKDAVSEGNFVKSTFDKCHKDKRIRCAVVNDLSIREMDQLTKVPTENRNPDINLIKEMAKINYFGSYQEAVSKDRRAIEYVCTTASKWRNTQWRDYNDYIAMLDANGEEKTKVVLYPKYFWDAHDRQNWKVQASKEKEKSLSLNQGIKKNCLAHMKMSYGDKEAGLLIRPAVNREELIKESSLMHHCVKMYDERVAKQETEIFFVRRIDNKNKPLVTLELEGNKIIQCRAKFNACPGKDVQKFVDSWAERNGFFKIFSW